MRMNKKLLLTASVFFVLLVVIGCGIPSIFHNELSFKRNTSTTTTVSGTFTFEKPARLNDIEDGTGPSLMLGYIVTDSPNAPSFSSEFNKQYRKSIHNGSGLSNSFILSIKDSSDREYALYQFSDKSGSKFRTPYLAATAVAKTSPDFTCVLTLDADNSITLSFTQGSYSINATANTLVRFNADNFTSNTSDIIANPLDYPDYSISATPGTLHCHVFGAVNVSDGLFTNVFWSSLEYFGSLALNV